MAKKQTERKGAYIYFLLFFSFIKIPYVKNDNNFVLSCRPRFFAIYYTEYQIFKHCTIFARNRTFRTKMHKNRFCTQKIDSVRNKYDFCMDVTI